LCCSCQLSQHCKLNVISTWASVQFLCQVSAWTHTIKGIVVLSLDLVCIQSCLESAHLDSHVHDIISEDTAKETHLYILGREHLDLPFSRVSLNQLCQCSAGCGSCPPGGTRNGFGSSCTVGHILQCLSHACESILHHIDESDGAVCPGFM